MRFFTFIFSRFLYIVSNKKKNHNILWFVAHSPGIEPRANP